MTELDFIGLKLKLKTLIVYLLKGEPNNWNGQEHCQEFKSLSNDVNDISCNMNLCLICHIQTNTVFHLQGNDSN